MINLGLLFTVEFTLTAQSEETIKHKKPQKNSRYD